MKSPAPIAEMAARNPPVTRTMGIVPNPEGGLVGGVTVRSSFFVRVVVPFVWIVASV
jgi:hypothetical protein